uniref:Uncharacterized protein n=1 Tax=Panstrongylus lignarius TaxID=156445 RepID=A0A224Y179_9HEMI
MAPNASVTVLYAIAPSAASNKVWDTYSEIAVTPFINLTKHTNSAMRRAFLSARVAIKSFQLAFLLISSSTLDLIILNSLSIFFVALNHFKESLARSVCLVINR